MKKIMTRLQLVALLLLSFFAVSSAGAADIGAGQYKIGSDDAPVLATEYVQFLNDQSSTDAAWLAQSSYYDSSIMNTSHDIWSSSDAAIYRTGFTKGYIIGSGYTYTVIPGHEQDRIVAVYSEEIQTQFNEWRKDQAPKATTDAPAAGDESGTVTSITDGSSNDATTTTTDDAPVDVSTPTDASADTAATDASADTAATDASTDSSTTTGSSTADIAASDASGSSDVTE